MERESFESAQIAQILNEHFVPIKVDREERPDVDAVYMSFIQAATGGGGWPMTVFLTPERKPFTGGTYFPEERFAAILEKVHETWVTKRAEVEAQGDRVVATFKNKLVGVSGPGSDALSLQGLSATEAEARLREQQEAAISVGFRQLNETYDERFGGFGRSLKFPRPSELSFLLSVYDRYGAHTHRGGRALEMVLGTVQGMKCGGIRDHVGGGFHRYSTDAQWHVPHFEKMVYDNAQLLATYVHVYQVTGEDAYAVVAHDTARYLLRDMRDPEGGFYSAEDADSPSPTQGGQSREGAFYVWTRDEIHTALAAHGMTPAEEDRFCQLFGLEEGGNIKASADPHGELREQNVLHLEKRLKDVLAKPKDKAVVDKGRAALTAARADRQRPVRDEKVLACWTGLVISGLAKAGRVLQCPEYLEAAEQAARFVQTRMYDSQTKVLHRCAFHGELSSVQGLADDYALLARGLLDLYEATAKTSYLTWACELQETMDELFLCRPGEGRGYLSVSRDDASIAYPVSSTYDGAEPSATSVAVQNLLRLSVLTNHDERLMQAEEKQGKGQQEQVPVSFARRAERLLDMALQAPETPYEAPELLSSFGLYGPGLLQVILVGPKDSPATQALARVVHEQSPAERRPCLPPRWGQYVAGGAGDGAPHGQQVLQGGEPPGHGFRVPEPGLLPSHDGPAGPQGAAGAWWGGRRGREDGHGAHGRGRGGRRGERRRRDGWEE